MVDTTLMINLLKQVLNENSSKISDFCVQRLSDLRSAFFEKVFSVPQKIKSVILFNSDNEYLGVRGLEFFNNETILDVPHKISFGSVKSNRGFEINKIEKFFLVCTQNKQNSNWIRIEFQEPVEVSKICVYLRNNRGCYRWANTFCLSVISDTYEEKVIDSYAAIAAFINSLSMQYSNHSRYREICYAIRLIVELKCKYYKRFVTCIDEDAEAYNFDKKELVNFVNQKIVLDQKVQYTNAYGFVKTFSIWTDKEKITCLRNSNHVISLLRRFTPYVCFAYGSALGFVREPSYFIPHDCDIDIICTFDHRSFPSVEAFYEAVVPYLIDNGVKIETKDNWHMHLKYNNQRVDVFPSIITKDEKILIFPRNKEKLIDYTIMYPTIDIEVLGMECPIPKNVFKYLEIFYGKDWRVPIDKVF